MSLPGIRMTSFETLLIALISAAAVMQTSGIPAMAQKRNADKPELVAQAGHRESVHSAAFSPDGRLVLTGGADHTALLWDLASGRELRRFTGHSSVIYTVAFSPDGATVLTGSADNTARLWETMSGKELRRFAGHEKSLRSVVFSPDGRHALTGSDDGTARLWQVSDSIAVRTFKGHTGSVLSVAFSNDGQSVLTAGADSTARIWNARTGAEMRRVESSGALIAAAFSKDGRFVLTRNREIQQGRRDFALIFDTATGDQLRRHELAADDGRPTAISADGRVILIGSRLLEAGTGKEMMRCKARQSESPNFRPTPLNSGAFSPDGGFVLLGGSRGPSRLCETATGQEVQRFDGYANAVVSAALSPDGLSIITGSSHDLAALWNTSQSRALRAFPFNASFTPAALSPDSRFAIVGNESFDAETGDSLRTLPITSHVVFSADGRFILALGLNQKGFADNKTLVLIDPAMGSEVQRFAGHSGAVECFYFSPDERFVVSGSQDKTVRLWDKAAGRELWRFDNEIPVYDVVFSPDGRFVLTHGASNSLLLLDTATGRVARRLTAAWEPLRSLEFSPDGRFILTRSGDHSILLIETSTGLEARRFSGYSKAFSPDGRMLLTGGNDNTARLWEIPSGKEVRRFAGHSSSVSSVGFSKDGRFVITGGDATVRLWNSETAEELCRLISFRDGGWAAVDPAGRFDSNDLDDIKGLHWIMPSDPFKPLPVEIFMRQYYEPRLLARILAGERFKPIPNISELNRVQPSIKIGGIGMIETSPGDPASVSVTIEAASVKGEFTNDGKVSRESGVRNLRLFRDGQLAGYRDGDIKLDPGTGRAAITFTGIKLPRKSDASQVEFSAYAFNSDNVKSATDRRNYELPTALPPLKGRAYIIAVGVNAYENPRFDLNFAASDARLLGERLTAELAQRAEYAEVVSVSLISDYEMRNGGKAVSARLLKPDEPKRGERNVTEKLATKANLKRTLDLLAGRPVSAADAAGIPNAAKLRQARPEDLVLIAFAGHGYADRQGEGKFYFVTYDIGASDDVDEILRRSVSSDELSHWLRDVDAGELTMIVDACQSSAAVTGEGFKPGPMGSRGLGQLSYEKGMRILTATQADNVALETRLIRHGLLTYALVRDGLELGRADFKPKDLAITLAEWLAYGAARVPNLYELVKSAKADALSADGARLLIYGGSKASGKSVAQVQQPSLFDFSRRRREVILRLIIAGN